MSNDEATVDSDADGNSSVSTLNSSSNEEAETGVGDVVPELPQGGPLQEDLARVIVVDSSNSDNSDDFQEQPLKRRKTECSEEQKAEENEELNVSSEDGQTCPICFEPWSNSGVHRLSSLRCGHLFGHSCIDKWLKGQGSKCPHCNAKAKRKDIRVIYAKSLTVVDTSEKDRALQELEAEKKARILAQKSEAQAIVQFQLARVECDKLQQRVKDLEERLKLQGTSSSSGPSGVDVTGQCTDRKSTGQYVGVKNIQISQHGEARVAAFDQSSTMLVVSKPSNNRLLPGFGLLKISGLELRSSEFVSIHSGLLRDVVCSPCGDGLVMTVALDKTLKVTSMSSNSVVQSYSLPGPAWSCAWDSDSPCTLYCGLHNGTIVVFDTRNTSEHLGVHRLDKHCPVTSLAFAPRNRPIGFVNGGIMAGTLESVVFCEKKEDSSLKTYPLSHYLPEGSCTSVSHESITNHCLVSFRPGKRSPQSRHLVGQVTSSATDFKFPIVHQFQGSPANKLLSKSLLYLKPEQDTGQLFAAFGNEGKKTAQIYDCSTGDLSQELSGDGEPVLDILPFAVNTDNFLSLLTGHKLLVYRWT